MDKFNRVNKYDQDWIEENLMGPNPLYLLEELITAMELKEGMRVLDMGCGKGLTSIFLAEEFGVQVWATDLWIDPTDNWERIKKAEVEDRVFPIEAEAHELPYAEGFFDAIISIDAYHYFGTDDSYLPNYFHKLVKEGGEIGIVVPGLTRELEAGTPKSLKEHWASDMYTFHSAEWWQNHWGRHEFMNIKCVENIADSKEIWLTSQFEADEKLITADTDDYLTFVMMLANRK
jgi:cyclopropane fatty-acyl-phospholipid synthase-like methyltransferase